MGNNNSGSVGFTASSFKSKTTTTTVDHHHLTYDYKVNCGQVNKALYAFGNNAKGQLGNFLFCET